MIEFIVGLALGGLLTVIIAHFQIKGVLNERLGKR